ncbi:MAG: hypothetical protein H6688_01675 [Erysipelotrichaceae bacterium]|nr:hypothetical protein [Erysipelotrichaceae bacterium]
MMTKSPNKWLFFSNFSLKLLALFFMTCDHVGFMLQYYYLTPNSPIVIVLRVLGRLAMPLFCFLIYEGVSHTRNFGKYALRLGLMAAFISGAFAFLIYADTPFSLSNLSATGNIFLDLLLGAVALFCLKHPKGAIKWLALLPVLYGILCFGVTTYEANTGAIINWLPQYIRTQYGWFGIVLIIGFYLGYLIKEYYLSTFAINSGLDKEILRGSSFDINATRLANMAVVVIVCLILYGLTWIISIPYLPYQWVALFSGALLLCYNGKRGYNKAWFEYGAYLYYPLHLAIIAVIFYLITL